MKVQRSLLWSCILALALVHRSLAVHDARQILRPPPQTGTTAPAEPTTSATTPSETSTTPPSTAPTTSPTTSPSSTAPPATTTPQTSNTPPPPTTLSTSTPIIDTSASVAPDVSTITSDGTAVTITITNSVSSTSTSASASATSSQSADDDGGGLSTGSIIGMSVAAGVAVIGIVAFFVWKFTRKRFNDFDDNEAIKWPELNSHSGNNDSHPLPARETGRAGFDTGSEADLSRVNSASVYSAPDLNASTLDPYAIPPLPHLNPNQPYRDDPSAAPSGYYDPYRGPVPGTIENGASDWQPEAYPMTQLGGPPAGRASPAPDYMYDGGRTQSPAPHTLYGGRSTPGLHAGYGGRVSPGPQVAYSGGAVSPAPNVGYDPYGAR